MNIEGDMLMKIRLIFIFMLMMGISLAAEPQIDPSYQIDWSKVGVYNVANYGAIPNDALDDAPAIHAAILAAYTAGGGTVDIPPGRFMLATRMAPGLGTDGAFLSPMSHVRIRGAGMGITTLKVADSMRTSTQSCAILFDPDYTSGHICHDFVISDITFDGNAQNNRWYPGWTSYWDRVGAANAGDGIIERCEFTNITGEWCIQVMGASREAGCKNVIIRDNVIRNVCTAAINDSIPDFSCIYTEVWNATVENNIIEPATMVHIAAGIELHSAGSIARNNNIKNLGNGILLGNNGGTVANSQMSATGNRLEVDGMGIVAWGFAGKQFETVDISGNEILMLSTSTSGSYGIIHLYGPLIGRGSSTKHLKIDNNLIIGNATTPPAYGIMVNNVLDGVITRNDIRNTLKSGIYVFSNTTTPRLIVKDNILSQWGIAATSEEYGMTLTVDATIADLQILNNAFSNTLTAATGYGILGYIASGPVVLAKIKGNTFACTLTQKVLITGYSGTSYVRIETEEAAAPTAGQHNVGSICWNTNPSAGGPPGWMCTTTSAPGTWKAMANLAA